VEGNIPVVDIRPAVGIRPADIVVAAVRRSNRLGRHLGCSRVVQGRHRSGLEVVVAGRRVAGLGYPVFSS
jgi:hypothetical protein